MIGAARGYRVRLCVPENVTPERKRILRGFGADIVFTDPMQGSDGAILRAREMFAADPDRYFYPDQYNNPGNWRSHYDTTGAGDHRADRRARSRTSSPASARAARSSGAGRRLREFNPAIRLISVQPDSPLHGLEGLKHMETAIVPGIYDPSLADEDARRVDRGRLRVDPSTGARAGCSSEFPAVPAWPAALDVAQTRHRTRVIVTIFPDGGEKYLSERFWDRGDAGPGSDGRRLRRVGPQDRS